MLTRMNGTMLRIRAERLARGWSQTVLAYRAGLSKCLYWWESQGVDIDG